jgi:hypothetical protein
VGKAPYLAVRQYMVKGPNRGSVKRHGGEARESNVMQSVPVAMN